jgi:hypothetical protein
VRSGSHVGSGGAADSPRSYGIRNAHKKRKGREGRENGAARRVTGTSQGRGKRAAADDHGEQPMWCGAGREREGGRERRRGARHPALAPPLGRRRRPQTGERRRRRDNAESPRGEGVARKLLFSGYGKLAIKYSVHV